ncbi:MAG: hypothetical protein WDO56_11565 [Gammaproteobacteria bacterium]
MNMKTLARNFLFPVLLGIACSTAVAGEATAAAVEQQVSGLWYYTTLTTDSGEKPLTGVFLFKDGIFIQQAIFDGENFNTSRAMAHAGPYQAFDTHVHLVAEQTISTAPDREAPLSFRSNTEHDVTVARDGDRLRLQFNMGTGIIQDFKYVGRPKAISTGSKTARWRSSTTISCWSRATQMASSPVMARTRNTRKTMWC